MYLGSHPTVSTSLCCHDSGLRLHSCNTKISNLHHLTSQCNEIVIIEKIRNRQTLGQRLKNLRLRLLSAIL